MSDITRLLQSRDPHAADELLTLVYDELRRLAAQRLAHEKPGQTLDPTGLVHEAYLRLVGTNAQPYWDDRGHFFAAAAEAMRPIRIENASRRMRKISSLMPWRSLCRRSGLLSSRLLVPGMLPSASGLRPCCRPMMSPAEFLRKRLQPSRRRQLREPTRARLSALASARTNS